MTKKLRILVLVNSALIPPEEVKSDINIEKMPWKTEYFVIKTLKDLNHQVMVLGVEWDLKAIRQAKESFNPHIAFNLLEEFRGEAIFDHNVVSYLELIQLPYTGCNPKGLLLSRDKALSKKILSYHRIKMPQFIVAKRFQKFKRPQSLEFPLIVKSLIDEGSVGISQNSIVNDDTKLQERIDFVHQNNECDAIVESYIDGHDVYVSLFGNKKITVLPMLKLHFKNAPDNIHKIATSKVKWSPEYRKKYQIILQPMGNLTDELISKIESTSKRIYRTLGINGYARLDLRITSDNKIYFIEANPNPDVAAPDEFAQSAKLGGFSYPELLNRLLTLGLNWRPFTNYR